MNSTGYTCFTGCQVQTQRGGSKNLDTSALGHGGRGWGVSALATGGHKRLLRRGERCSNWRRGSPRCHQGGSVGGGAGPRDQLGGCGDGTRRREPEMTRGRSGGEGSERCKGNPSTPSRTRAWCPVGHRDLCLHPRVTPLEPLRSG